MSWVKEVMEVYRESEAPQKFFYWAALASISAVIRKNIFLDRFHYKLYPNIYVFIVAGSGMKKGIPINFAKSVVEKTGAARIISGRNSMQAIMKDLSMSKPMPNGLGPIKEAQAFIISGELAAFLVRDPDALTILTDLHDTGYNDKEWVNTLKGTGIDVLKQPNLTLIGATNEEHFSDFMPLSAIGGGFVARTFIVYASEGGKPNSLTDRPANVPDTQKLCEYLKSISAIKGEFKYSHSGKNLYDDWYYNKRERVFDPTGSLNRIGDQVLKVSMLISLAKGDSLILTEDDIQESIEVCQACIAGMRHVTMGQGRSTLAAQMKAIIRELVAAPDHKITRAKILQKYWGEMDAFDLDRITETMAGTGNVQVLGNGAKTVYCLTKDGIEMFVNFEKSVRKGIQ